MGEELDMSSAPLPGDTTVEASSTGGTPPGEPAGSSLNKASPPNATDGAAEPDPRLFLLDRLYQAGRLTSFRKLASHVAHEVGTPLNVIEARAMMMASGDITGEAIEKNARIIAEQAGRITKIIREVLALSRRDEPPAAPVDLLEIARTAISLVSLSADQRGVRVSLSKENEPTMLSGKADALLEVALNLLLNGVQATPEGSTVTIAVRPVHRPSPDSFSEEPVAFAMLEVKDEGSGISKETLPHIWKPFFTTTSGRAGLGLSIAQGITKDHGGFIEVESDVGQGSCFRVYLPRGVS